MAFIDEYTAALENDNQFRQRVAIAISRRILNSLAGSPNAAQQALGKRFLLNPSVECDRYLLPVAARLAMNGGSFTDDAALQTAVDQVLVINVSLGIA